MEEWRLLTEMAKKVSANCRNDDMSPKQIYLRNNFNNDTLLVKELSHILDVRYKNKRDAYEIYLNLVLPKWM